MTYYKVVNCLDNKYYSATVNLDLLDDYVTEYKVGRVTKPTIKNTKLFIFNNLADAKAFKSRFCSSSGRVFECIPLNPSHIRYIGQAYEADKFWECKWLHKALRFVFRDLRCEPEYKNAMACDALKLTKEVV